MGRRVQVVTEGRHYRLGRTSEYGGIWKKRPWGWKLISRYPLTEEGWRVAQQQFASMEPEGSGQASETGLRSRRRTPWLVASAFVLIAVVVFIVVALTDSSGTDTVGTSFSATTLTSSPPVSTTTPAGIGSGLLATDDSTYAEFIQWSGTGGYLSGTLQIDVVDGTPPNATVSTKVEQVQAQLNGTQIQVNLGDYGQVFGTYSDGTLRVNIPQQNGTLQEGTFQEASTTAFNSAVAQIQAGLSTSNSSAAQQQQIQAQQSAIDKAAAAVQHDLQALGGDEGNLTQSLAQLPGAVAQEKGALATTASDEQKVVSEAQSGTPQDQVCTDADGVATDADGVNTAGDGVSTQADSVVNVIHSTQGDIASTQQDFDSLQQAQSAQPTYEDGAPSSTTVNQAVATAQAAIASAVKSTNGSIGTANSYESQAYQDAQAAAASDSCSPPSQPTYQPTISASS